MYMLEDIQAIKQSLIMPLERAGWTVERIAQQARIQDLTSFTGIGQTTALMIINQAKMLTAPTRADDDSPIPEPAMSVRVKRINDSLNG